MAQGLIDNFDILVEEVSVWLLDQLCLTLELEKQTQAGGDQM